MKVWKFDATIAEVYDDHVNAHIPNYHRVISKTLDICNELCEIDDSIIDVGCANGATLTKLYEAGFRNLHGVDSSAAMIDICDSNIASIIHSSTLPTNKYKAIILNWVLHFNSNKVEYLQDVYDNLIDGGFAIVTDKVSEDPLMIDFYHRDKLRQGLSKEQVEQKQKQLTNVMTIHSAEWYQHAFDTIGFSKVHLIDADWCFASYLIFK